MTMNFSPFVSLPLKRPHTYFGDNWWSSFWKEVKNVQQLNRRVWIPIGCLGNSGKIYNIYNIMPCYMNLILKISKYCDLVCVALYRWICLTASACSYATLYRINSSSGYLSARLPLLEFDESAPCDEVSVPSASFSLRIFLLLWVEVDEDKSSIGVEEFGELLSLELAVRLMLESFFSEYWGSSTTFPLEHFLIVELDKDKSCIFSDLLDLSDKFSVWDPLLHVITAHVCDEVCWRLLDCAAVQISMCSGWDDFCPVNRIFILRYRGKVKVLFTLIASISWNYKSSRFLWHLWLNDRIIYPDVSSPTDNNFTIWSTRHP